LPSKEKSHAGNVTEITPNVSRISTFHPEFGIQFNQFLVADEEPFIMHTGMKKMFPTTLEGVSSILDPGKLRWIGFSHFESDECGALNEWLSVAPRAQAVCSFVGAVDPEPLTDSSTLGRARNAILENLSGPLAHDMPYTAQTNDALKRLALLHPQTLAAMHGSSFTGDGQKEIADLAALFKATIGKGVESL
jgi:ODP family beta lactamase